MRFRAKKRRLTALASKIRIPSAVLITSQITFCAEIWLTPFLLCLVAYGISPLDSRGTLHVKFRYCTEAVIPKTKLHYAQ
mmetsp:Transcript_29384/g.32661  ORF Transcript_29384/g.32661 Transcript_29384/m.32661 type:complete len:80 (-) Transcript_29384:91-330(-)